MTSRETNKAPKSMLALCLLFCLALQASAWAQATYSITDLGTLGGDNSVPIWITNTGDVIGISDTGQFDAFGNPIDHAFRWSKGRMQDLCTLGDVDSIGLGGNDVGAAVGNNFYNINHALLWYGGAVADLGTLIGPSGFSWAQQLNNQAEIVGGSAAADGTFHAVVWADGSIRDLGTLAGPRGSVNSLANGINDLGQIVGDSRQNNVPNIALGFPPFFPTIWIQAVPMKLSGEPSYTLAGDAFNINNKGQVVGRIGVADPNEGMVSHAYLWANGVMQDLGVPFGDDNSEAVSLNDDGQIVGDSGVGFILGYAPDHALLWRNGQWLDLNTLIPQDSGYYLIKALAVNARGQIVVCAVNVDTGNVHAALLSSQPFNATPGNSGNAHLTAPRLSANAQRLLTLLRSRPRRAL